MLPTDFLRTTSFRIALAYAALFSLSALVLFAVIYLATAGYSARQMTAAIDEDLATLHTDYLLGGWDNVTAEIVTRLNASQDKGRYYLLETPDGRVVTGNLSSGPPHPGWRDLSAQSGAPNGNGPASNGAGNSGPRRHVRARGIFLPDGSYLLVGRDASTLDELEGRIVQAFLWGIGATLILAAAGAVVMSVLSQRRVDAMRRATEEIMAGNMARRIPVSGARDEFDRLGGQVNRMLDRIQSLMAGLAQVSSAIAHDLKTPLSRLRQQLELARHRAASVAEYQVAVDGAIEECDQALRLFDALLRIAQIEAGSRRSGFQPFDLSAVIRTVGEAYEPVAEESGHRLETRAADGVILNGDKDLVTQMLSNLIENAIRHTPQGCLIALALECRPGGGCQLTVADDGPGIPEGERAKVLQRFYRLDASRTTPGSGLGLSLVAAVAQLHDMTLTLGDNNPGLRVGLVFQAAPVLSA